MKYYSLSRIKKKHAIYNMIIGERSNGKTYSCLENALKDFVQSDFKNTFAYVRRWKEDIRGKRAQQVFNGLNENGVIAKLTGGEYTHVYYNSGRYYLCTYNEEGKAIYNQEEVFGYLFALSDMEHDKGATYSTVTSVIFDEFMTRGTYLSDEFMLFMNVLSTIVRRRENVTIYMLANTVNKYCPYFKEMGLTHAMTMEQGTIDVYGYGDSKLSVAVEYCSSMESNKTNNFYFAFNNPKLEMITGGVWELDIYPHCPIKYTPKNIEFIYFICFNDYIYQCECISKDDNFFTFIHLKTTELKDPENDLIYSFDYNPLLNYNRSILNPKNNLERRVKWFFDTERVFYSDNEVGDAIHNYLNICRKGV